MTVKKLKELTLEEVSQICRPFCEECPLKDTFQKKEVCIINEISPEFWDIFSKWNEDIDVTPSLNQVKISKI